MWPDLCGQLQKQRVLKSRSLQQLATPVPLFAFKIAETLQGVQGFWGRSHPSPCMALQYTFLCCKLDVVVCLPSLCIKHKNFYLVTVLYLSHTQVRMNCVPSASFDLTLLHIFCKRYVQVVKLHRPYHELWAPKSPSSEVNVKSELGSGHGCFSIGMTYLSFPF